MKHPIILLSGGTGVGTSRFSLELAKVLDIPAIMSTDYIREVVRSIINPNINPTLNSSTYAAGQTVHYNEKDETVRKSEILRAYKIQCTSISVGVEGIIKRAVNENTPLIVEGVHLIPGKIRDSEIYKQSEDIIEEYLVHIDNPQIHKERFFKRQKEAPDRRINKYLKNFQEIRWIHDYLIERANRFQGIPLINNTENIQAGLDKLLSSHYSKRV